jgi:flagellar hook-associated protein 2
MTSIPAYQASGLASKMDTQGIIEKLVQIEGIPLTTIATKQAAVTTKISAIGTLMSHLETLSSTAKNLATGGITTVSATGSYSDFSVSGAPANAGRYTVNVEGLARAAKTRSTTVYNSADAVVTATAKDLKLSVDGTIHTIAVTAGTTLNQLVTQINGANKPFTASLVSDGSQYYLTITNKSSGFVVGQPATHALSVVDEGGVPQDLGLGLSSPANLQATNAVVHVDGLRIERRNNEITDVVPGATLTLKAASNTDANLVFATDTGASEAKLNAFVNNYNKLAAFLSGQVESNPGLSVKGDKLGSSIVYGIQRRLQQLISTPVVATGTFRTIKEIGISLQKDGTLKLDSAKLSEAMAKDPTAVNALFSTATNGLGDSISTYVTSQTDGTTGILVGRREGLEKTTKSLTQQADRITRHLESYRRQLNIQFLALEKVMSGVNNIALYLDQQEAQLRAQQK